MYAIIEESGGQRKVEQGQEFLMDLLSDGAAKPGDTVTFDKVLVVGEAGGKAKVGLPYVPGASVTAQVVEPVVKGQKIHVWTFREKKTWQKKRGHRQQYTGVKVTGIVA
ncbi:MAG: 50S ribosomal protein L21 [Phycisphaerae bacterium]|nr:50S ribosomal protein L21 [Phycisphaerae bacterium]